MGKSEELFRTTEYLTLYSKYRINRCLYNRVRLYIISAHVATPFGTIVL